MADIGWITGHSYIVYGPLSICASSVVYEGIPNYPDAGRCWRIAEELNINIFHTAPTVIRALRKIGPDEPAKYNYNFKHMTTVGEPIEPAVWKRAKLLLSTPGGRQRQAVFSAPPCRASLP
jgi:acetyl-CoA synthetase